MDRVATGITHFDDLIEGGFPVGSNILLGGNPGAGKTIFGLHFINNGASTYKEPGVYVSTEQSIKDLRLQGSQMDLQIDKLERQKLLKLVCIQADEIDRDIVERIKKACKEVKAKRLVIDSISFILIGLNFDIENKYALINNEEIVTAYNKRQYIYNFIKLLESLKCTTIFVSGIDPATYETEDKLSAYMCDGMVVLRARTLGQVLTRTLEVLKLRLTEIKGGIYPMKITKDGIEIVQ